MNVHDLIREAPRFHLDMGWRDVSLQASDDVLLALDALVEPGWATLETGAGASTVVFAMKGALHTAVVPAAHEVERIRAWCAAHDVATDRVTFRVAGSETVLPRLEPTPLDLVLIDGGHAFPTPFIDWYYTAARLRIGGLLLVDDVNLWTGRVLRDFLAAEPTWTLRQEFAARSVLFEKVGEPPVQTEWTEQPYVVRRSHVPGTFGFRWRTALALLRRGRFRALRDRLSASAPR